MGWTYDEIKDEAARLGCKVTDLIALAPANDPMYSGKPSDKIAAKWFGDLWDSFGYGSGVHLRRVHYQIISQDPPIKLPSPIKIGTDERTNKPIYTDVYQNYDACWNYLTQASKQARYLGYVDPAAFDDRRNPEATINAQLDTPEPQISIYRNMWSAPRLPDFADLPSYQVYDFEARQRYMIEVWAEKSTMNDVLKPLCEEFGANLQTGLGELSITATLNAVRRIERGGRPTRIFYIADFDPAGRSMPVAVSRKIEYFISQFDDSLDVRLIPIVLTPEQIRQYRLPRTPIKDTEKRAAKFETQFGEGAVELDALEALHPGALARIVRGHMRDYYDRNLYSATRSALAELHRDLELARQEAIKPYAADLAKLKASYAEIKAEFEARIETYAAEQTRLWQAISDRMEQEQPSIYDYPLPEAEEADQDNYNDALFDTNRGYVEQIGAYKNWQGKEAVEA